MNTRLKPWTLFLILAIIFSLPMLGAWYFYQHHMSWTGRTINHGQLLQPMLRIENLSLTTPEQQVFNAKQQWHHQWVLLYINPSVCKAECLDHLRMLRQVHKAMGKYQEKITRAYVTTEPLPKELLSKIHNEYHATALKASTVNLAHFFLPAKHGSFPASGLIFIVDPQGYVMMSYPTTFKPNDIYEDLQKLMQVN